MNARVTVCCLLAVVHWGVALPVHAQGPASDEATVRSMIRSAWPCSTATARPLSASGPST